MEKRDVLKVLAAAACMNLAVGTAQAEGTKPRTPKAQTSKPVAQAAQTPAPQTPAPQTPEGTAVTAWDAMCRAQAPSFSRSIASAMKSGYVRQKPGVYIRPGTRDGFALASSKFACGCTLTFGAMDAEQSIPRIRNELAARYRLSFEQNSKGDWIAPVTFGGTIYQVLVLRVNVWFFESVGIGLVGTRACPVDQETLPVTSTPA